MKKLSPEPIYSRLTVDAHVDDFIHVCEAEIVIPADEGTAGVIEGATRAEVLAVRGEDCAGPRSLTTTRWRCTCDGAGRRRGTWRGRAH